ncbi:uncharacterized protein [Narcine bancroftii]|uniref:uncharacterized protein isoform X5 n=1 Tax=Narcine bancroftii TaxID=1343680 RepID=UPI00383199DF
MEWHNLPHNPQPTPQNRSLEQEYSGNNLCPIKCTSHCPGKCRVSVVWTRTEDFNEAAALTAQRVTPQECLYILIIQKNPAWREQL